MNKTLRMCQLFMLLGIVTFGVIPQGKISDVQFSRGMNLKRNEISFKQTNEIGGPISANPTLWATNGFALFHNETEQNSPKICSDGSGGFIIVWQDERNTNRDIFAQRLNAAGERLWDTNNIEICTATGDQVSPIICEDGAGGALIVWQDQRSGTNWDLYTQRINSNGEILWTTDGIAVSTATGDQLSPEICSDGAGGVIITWYDSRLGSGSLDIYASRIGASGTVMWTADGVPICTAAHNQFFQKICSDGDGGAIITWEDYRDEYDDGDLYIAPDIFAQRINSTGDLKWTTDGVIISNAEYDQCNPAICSDNDGGAIITWDDWRYDTHDIYAQRINSTGDVKWALNGTIVSENTETEEQNPEMCSDANGGAIIAWTSSANIYAQRIDSNGMVQWITNGVPICTASNGQNFIRLCKDNAGGAIMTWLDYRASVDGDIFAQAINSTGQVLWDTNGINVCSAQYNQEQPAICTDGHNGAFLAWGDSRYYATYKSDIYVQRLITEYNPETPDLENIDPKTDVDGNFWLNWSDVPMVDSYTVYQYNSAITEWNSSVITLATVLPSEYYVSNLPLGVHYFAVIATNETGNSSFSNSIWVNVEDLPATPFLISIDPETDIDGDFLLNWDDIFMADNYTLYQSSSPIESLGEGITPIATVSASEYLMTGLSSNVYYFAVIARNETGVSSLSNSIKVIVDIPDSDEDSDDDSGDINDNNIAVWVVIGVGIAAAVAGFIFYTIKKSRS